MFLWSTVSSPKLKMLLLMEQEEDGPKKQSLWHTALREPEEEADLTCMTPCNQDRLGASSVPTVVHWAPGRSDVCVGQ